MSTYNGEKYLAEQIDSILAQEDVRVELFVRDDGSIDDTKNILTEYADHHENIHLDFGDNIGLCKSFLQELISIPNYEYYSFSDQDDYWEKDKLSIAVNLVKQKEKEATESVPVLYYSYAYKTDSNLNIISISKKNKYTHTLEGSALFRNVGGCTMLLNAQAREIFSSRPLTENMMVHNHDCLVLSLVCALGGTIVLDDKPHMMHRVHGENASRISIGAINRLKSHLKNLRKYRGCEAKIARAILDTWGDKVTPQARDTLETIAGHKDNFALRLKIVFSPKFRTGIIIRTTLGKLRALLGWL